jgi:hypothetical protein
MNEPKKTDFFPEIDERDAHLTAPDIYEPYQDTEEDLFYEESLRELEAKIHENSGAATLDDLGELPFDEKADRKRWDELEKDFDRIFEDSARRANELEPTLNQS